MLAEEEASVLKKKASPKTGAKKASAGAKAKPADPSDIAAGGALSVSPESSNKDGGATGEVESFAATGIDNALDLLEVVTAKMDKASIGNQAATIEKHPEVRALTFSQAGSHI